MDSRTSAPDYAAKEVLLREPFTDDDNASLLVFQNLRQPQSRWRCTAFSFLRIASEVIILAVVLWFVLMEKNDVEHYESVGSDMSGFVPHTLSKVVEFQGNSKYVFGADDTEMEKKTTHRAWRDLFPVGQGMLSIPDWTERPELQAPMSISEHEDVFGISLYHQLHCLYQIMTAYDSLRTANHTNDDMASMNHTHSFHIEHCFDYLRQSLMCCGDSALEGQATNFPVGMVGTNGWGVQHVCRDYSDLGAFAIKHRASDEEGI